MKKTNGSRPTGLRLARPGLNDESDLLDITDDQRGRLKALAERDADLLIRAHRKYGDSWRKRGGGEAYHNLTRKWDRIERAVESLDTQDLFEAIRLHPAMSGDIMGKDGLLDDIGDLRRYLMLVEEYVTREGRL